MNSLKKVCVVTAARSEYGLLRWLIEEVKQDDELVLQLLVSGSHLSVEQGLTYRQIEADGYVIDEKVEMLLSSHTDVGIVKSMGLCSIGIADSLKRLSPDLLVVLGDRYELLPICSAALLMSIPIAHISGGDVTEGAIDDQVRNAVTMMASLHFPGVEESADRIVKMRGSRQNVWSCGEPGLDNFTRLSLWDRSKLAADLRINETKKWILVSYHPETKISLEQNIEIVGQLQEALDGIEGIEVVITRANADLGGVEINMYWENLVKENGGKYKLFDSLGQLRYLSLMKETACVLGNSSSGIVEASFLGIPVVNIGHRQKGRYLCKNVISIEKNNENVGEILNKLLQEKRVDLVDNYYGDGHTSERIKNRIKEYFE